MDDAAADDLAQQRAQGDWVHSLGDRTLGAGLEGLVQPLLIRADGEQQGLGLGAGRDDVTQPLERVRGIRDEIERRVVELAAGLDARQSGSA